MSLTFKGDACAHIPGEKSVYRKIGAWFEDEKKQVCVKIDSLPLPQSGWLGWINLFPAKDTKQSKASQGSDDDIPF